MTHSPFLASCLTLLALSNIAFLAACSGTSSAIVTPTPEATPISNPTPAPGQSRIDTHGVEQVRVPPGTFLMGTAAEAIEQLKSLNPPGFVLGEFPSEQPQHPVRITQGYWIDKYEVTNAAFRAFVVDGGYQNQVLWSPAGWDWLSQQIASQLPNYCLGNLPDNPLACVTWFEAEAYANWRGGRLPTEA